MRPKLKVNEIKDLHDARYCSAVGIYLLGFNLQNGNDDKVTAKMVKEVMGWLSGPESIGEFAYETQDEINATQEEYELNYVGIPMDYHPDLAGEIKAPLIFRFGEEAIQAGPELSHLLRLCEKFPEALFELSIDPGNAEVWEEVKEANLVQRSLFRFEDPDSIYNSLKKGGQEAFGFALGEFVEEPGGNLDYQKCDDFVERYDELLPV